MGFALRAGLSFCQVGDHLMFLDLPRDRYFCLSPPLEAAFRKLISAADDQAARSAVLDGLGLVVSATSAAPIEPCRVPARTGESMLESTRPGEVGALSVIRASIAIGIAVAELKTFGLKTALRSVKRRKERENGPGPDADDILAIVRAFHATRYLFGAHERCLTRSIAMARLLLAAGAKPDLVIAVKLQPFMAHCWVQIGETLVNDHEDVVRDYTPILVV